MKKSRNRLFFFGPISALLITLLTICILSCSKDSDNIDRVESKIVGSWSCDNHYYGGSYGGTDTYVFKSDGTYTWSCTGDWWEDAKGHYVYDEDSGVLLITNSRGTKWVYQILSLTNSSFILVDEDGYRYRYYRN